MGIQKRFTIISQGCRLNHSETASLVNELQDNGLEEVDLEKKPDIVVINTCTVTENGDKDTIRLIRKINSNVKKVNIALIGCQAQIKQNKLSELENVKWVIGNEYKNKTAKLILSETTGVHAPKIKQESFFQEYSSFDPKHTRVNLKIQDGCDFYCSFCIIPFARGPARSREYNNIIDDAKGLINMGVKELVLTGINLGTYKNSGKDFYELLEALLNLNKNTRIRISSIEPTTIGNRLINIWKNHSNFCQYLHLPIQSGTDEVLKSMRRKYSTNEYIKYVKEIKKELPNICIGTDVIVGFPGETDELFESTFNLLKNNPIEYFHVFSYSERSMAHSRKFDNRIDKNTIKLRSLKLRTLHNEKWSSYMNKHINSVIPVLFEQEKNGYWHGTSEHFLKIKVKSDRSLKNKIKNIKLININDKIIEGEFA